MGSALNPLPRGFVTLPRSFYLRPTLTVARSLLGTYLVRKRKKGILMGKIVEVEAYRGRVDPASHAFRGKTVRNEVMFRTGGHLYVYFTYGMHFCANVVTGREGVAEAVLLRALEPVRGIDIMKRRRNDPRRRSSSPYDLTNGPAKLCKAFGIGRRLNGASLLQGEILIARKRGDRRPGIATSTRIGIRSATQFPWRFTIRDSPWVSRGAGRRHRSSLAR